MNIFFDNVNPVSRTGPNHFGSKLATYLEKRGNTCLFLPQEKAEVRLSFIESTINFQHLPTVLRLDGIYFDPDQNYNIKNFNIEKSYNKADGVVFQSEYNKDICFKYFGEHKNYRIINNGADLELIRQARPISHPKLDVFETVWCCAASWRRWKRLPENISYFLKNSGPKDCLVIAGQVGPKDIVKHDRIFFVGDIDVNTLYSLYKRSKYMIHLARYDSCPNVVVDARAAGCKIVCSSIAGTKEVAGPNAIVLYEEPWDYNPVSTTNLPNISFDKVVPNSYNTNIDMLDVSERYENFIKETLNVSPKRS